MAGSTKVIVYVKKDCGLCGPVWKTVQSVRKDIDFDVEKIDIASDPELEKKYALEVPVVTINGRKAFKGQMHAAAFKKKLKKAQAHGSTSTKVEATPVVEPEVFIPSRGVIALTLAIGLAGFGYFVKQGLDEAQIGRGKLAATLLRVEPVKNDLAIDFDLPTIDGKKLSLDDYRGKVLFLNFWATWCPPCIEEMPSMQRFTQRMKQDPRFEMLAVSTDDGWDPVKKFFEKGAPPFTVVLDKEGEIAKQYGTTKFPETYVVIDGRIVGWIVGPRDWDAWYAAAYAESVLEHGKRLKADQLIAAK